MDEVERPRANEACAYVLVSKTNISAPAEQYGLCFLGKLRMRKAKSKLKARRCRFIVNLKVMRRNYTPAGRTGRG